MNVLNPANSWKRRKIWNCFQIVNGATPSSGVAAFWDGDIPWVGPVDLGKLASKSVSSGERNITAAGYRSCGTSIVPAGTVILSSRAPIGHVAIASNPICFNQGCKGLIPLANIRSAFAYWLLLSLRPALEAAGRGTTFMELSRGNLRNVEFHLPPLEEQAVISAFLEKKSEGIDSAIQAEEEQIALLRERRQVLIREAVLRGLRPDASKKDSNIDWIGEIPSHWRTVRFKHLFTQSRLPVRIGAGVVTAFRDGQVTLRSNRRLSGYTEAILEGGYQGIRSGQLVLNSMDAFEGAIGVSDSDGKCTPEYVICDPSRNIVNQNYFAYLLREMALAKYIQVVCSAVRQRAVRIRFNDLAPLFMPLPSVEEQAEIVTFIEGKKDEIWAAISLKEKQIGALKEYRSILIDAAVTGKIKVA